MTPQTNVLRTVARRTPSDTLVRSKIIPTRRWQHSEPPGPSSGFDLPGFIRGFVPDGLERPYAHIQLLRMALPRAAPEFEEFVNSIGKTKAIVHHMRHLCSQVVFEDKDKTADYVAEINGSIFPPGATIEQGGIPLTATAILDSTSLPGRYKDRYHGKRNLHLENMPSLVHPSQVPYHEVKEWIESRCGCKTVRLGLVLRNFGRSDFAEDEMPPAVKVMFDASPREKHVFLTTGGMWLQVDGWKVDAIQRFNSLPPADRTYPGAKEPAVLAKPLLVRPSSPARPDPARPDDIPYETGVCASLIPRHVRRSDIDEDAVFNFVSRHLRVWPKKVVVREWPFYQSQFPQHDRPPELDGPDSPGVTMLTSGWVSIEFSSKDRREEAMMRWHHKSLAKKLPESTKVLFLRTFGRWHESSRSWMRWMSREELDKVTFPYKFLRENAKSWNPREPAIDDEDTAVTDRSSRLGSRWLGVTERLPPLDLRWVWKGPRNIKKNARSSADEEASPEDDSPASTHV